MADAPGSIFEKLMSENADVQDRGQEAQSLTGIDLSSYLNKTDKIPDINPAQPTVLDKVPSLGDLKAPIESNLAGGNALTGPDPMKSIDDRLSLLKNAPVENPYQWGKPFTFNTGVNNADFDRYYTHPQFSKLGYSPFRDNETLYNDKSSWLDDFNRMRHQWVGLTWEGVKSMWGSSDAEEFDRRNKIGASSKGGFGAFTTNLLLNTSYTIGVATDLMAEELALAGATALTGGMDAEVTIPAMAAELAKGTRALERASELGNTAKVMHGLEAAGEARNFWSSTKAGRAAAGAADFLNPLRYTTRAVYGIAKEAKGYKGLENLAKMSTTTGAFLRDLTRIRASYGEAKLEGDNVQMKLVDDLIGEYYKNNGKMPEGPDADRIYDIAKEGSFKTQLYNMPLLMVTNDMVFGKAFRGFQPKWLAKAELSEKIPMDIIEETNWKKLGVKPYEIAPDGIKKFLVKNYWKQAPSKVILGTLNYGKANFFEGAQETMQDMISGSINDYYQKIYHDPLLAGSQQQWASFKNGSASQLSGQGFETFLSGFLMGGILQVPQNLIMGYVPRLSKNYDEHKAAVEKQTTATVDAMNDVVMNTGKYTSAVEENAIHQKNLSKNMQSTESTNDRKGYQDAKNESMFTHVRTLLENGQYDIFHDAMKGMRDWTDQELADAFNVKAEANANNKDIRQRLEGTIEETENIRKRYETLSEHFSNPYDPNVYNKKSQPAQWLATSFKKQAFDDVKFHAIYGNYAFEKALTRMQSIVSDLSGAKKPLKNALVTDITSILDKTQFKDRRKSIEDEISAQSQGDAAQRAQGAKLAKQLEAMDELGDSMDAYSKLIDEDRAPGKEEPGTGGSIRNRKENAAVADDLKNSYFKYVKRLAKNHNEIVLDENIYPSLNSLMDYMELDKDSKSMAQYVNFLHNPDQFMNIVNRRYEAMQEQDKKRAETMKTALESYITMKDQNKGIFNDIFNEGVFLKEDGIEDLKAGNYENLKFYNADAPYGILDSKSEKYKKIMGLIEAYRQVHDKPSEEDAIQTITDKIVNAEPLTPDEEATRRENAQTVEDKLKQRALGAGSIIYGTLGTGKTSLAEAQPDKYVDGDEILFNHLKTLAEEYNVGGKDLVKVPTTAQEAGLAFTEFLKTQTPEDKRTHIAEIQQIFKDIAASGKNVLTASWFAKDIADKVYLRKDLESVMEELRKRGRTNVKTEAQRIMSREDAYFANRTDVQEIPAGKSITDMLEKGTPSVQEGHQSMIDKISKLDTMDAITRFEEDIIDKMNDDYDYLERYGFDGGTITELLNKRREEIGKTVTFATISKGNYLLMKDGTTVHVRSKHKDGSLTVKRQGDAKTSTMTPEELKNADRIVTKETMKEAPKMTEQDVTAAAENLKNSKEFLADPDARKKAIEESKDKSKGDSDEDLINSICT